ncbi:hypothetical protein SAMN05660657_05341 [Geodermatophilus amargosae]|uniref:Immunity protein 35 n=1 Tax=Geodermatophilus amargosae TaxID=1296565 RepID=A0A1I7D5J4_9ACTN|nr:hypothetical protein [Geodermatophilus amargosae]SFU06960.1 hypothetical protein SAMN05660657_05341 [Geodermatophilus amargosae]
MALSERTRRELLEVARREQGPVEVALFWDPDLASATVVVWNWSSGACLRLQADPEEAKYAYTHPYAYAATRGVPARDVLLAA